MERLSIYLLFFIIFCLLLVDCYGPAYVDGRKRIREYRNEYVSSKYAYSEYPKYVSNHIDTVGGYEITLTVGSKIITDTNLNQSYIDIACQFDAKQFDSGPTIPKIDSLSIVSVFHNDNVPYNNVTVYDFSPVGDFNVYASHVLFNMTTSSFPVRMIWDYKPIDISFIVYVGSYDADGYSFTEKKRISYKLFPIVSGKNITWVDLMKKYPNPFSPTTEFDFYASDSCNVVITIKNVAGEIVDTLKRRVDSAGIYSQPWDATGLPSGIYFYKIEDCDTVFESKMVLLK